MTFTINEHIMTLKYNKFKCYWAAELLKKTLISVYREGPSLCAQILNGKSAFSPATVRLLPINSE